MRSLNLSWVTPKFSYLLAYDFTVHTAQKPVIARVLTLFLCLLKTPSWYEKYEKYEIFQDWQTTFSQSHPGFSNRFLRNRTLFRLPFCRECDFPEDTVMVRQMWDIHKLFPARGEICDLIIADRLGLPNPSLDRWDCQSAGVVWRVNHLDD